MMLETVDIGPFEGLVRATAARYATYLDDDIEDIAQELRVKVWYSLQRYDRRRATQEIEQFVFSCVVNRVKDLLKGQSRLNARRNGGPLYVEDCSASNPSAFEAEHFSTGIDTVVEAVVELEKVELPSTITPDEKRVVVLLLLDLKQTEIAQVLGVPRSRVRATHTTIREKMADWSTAPALPAARERVAA